MKDDEQSLGLYTECVSRAGNEIKSGLLIFYNFALCGVVLSDPGSTAGKYSAGNGDI